MTSFHVWQRIARGWRTRGSIPHSPTPREDLRPSNLTKILITFRVDVNYTMPRADRKGLSPSLRASVRSLCEGVVVAVGSSDLAGSVVKVIAAVGSSDLASSVVKVIAAVVLSVLSGSVLGVVVALVAWARAFMSARNACAFRSSSDCGVGVVAAAVLNGKVGLAGARV